MKKFVAYGLIAYLTTVFIAGCGKGDDSQPEKIVADRQAVMRNMSGSINNLEKALFGDDEDGSDQVIAEHALLLQKFSDQISEKFSKESDSKNDQVNKQIQKDKEKFDEAANELQHKIDAFVAAVKTNDKEKIKNTYYDLNLREVCMRCHEQYRKTSK